MRNIVYNLNESSIAKAIKELKTLKADVETTIHDFLGYLIDHGVNIAKQYVRNIDTGETLDSIEGMFIDNNKGVIFAGGHAVWLEFGTGVYNNSSGYPMALPSGIVPIGTYGQGNGSNFNGWYYKTEDPRYILFRNRRGEGIGHTKGIEANKFMYKAMCSIRDNAPIWAVEWFDKL